MNGCDELVKEDDEQRENVREETGEAMTIPTVI